mmetsp:Transcript_31740/g.72437  ORF Transcript_31740/g.72437 Transcript_31740/m.72437 type:complete len:116 (+) Transcript_31740:1403-1750(+)
MGAQPLRAKSPLLVEQASDPVPVYPTSHSTEQLLVSSSGALQPDTVSHRSVVYPVVELGKAHVSDLAQPERVNSPPLVVHALAAVPENPSAHDTVHCDAKIPYVLPRPVLQAEVS